MLRSRIAAVHIRLLTLLFKRRMPDPLHLVVDWEGPARIVGQNKKGMLMRSRVPAIALAAAATAFGVSVAMAQAGQPSASASAPQPAPFKNLQVFPKDIARPELISNMRFFSQSLGVRCTFCHVGVEGQPPSTFDFASDSKKEKLIARKMLTMVHAINQQYFGVTDFSQVKVTCFTCHRGSAHPLKTPPAETPAATPSGAPAPAGTPAAPPRKPERGAV